MRSPSRSIRAGEPGAQLLRRPERTRSAASSRSSAAATAGFARRGRALRRASPREPRAGSRRSRPTRGRIARRELAEAPRQRGRAPSGRDRDGEIAAAHDRGAAKSQFGTSSMTFTSTPRSRAARAIWVRSSGSCDAATHRNAPSRSCGRHGRSSTRTRGSCAGSEGSRSGRLPRGPRRVVGGEQAVDLALAHRRADHDDSTAESSRNTGRPNGIATALPRSTRAARRGTLAVGLRAEQVDRAVDPALLVGVLLPPPAAGALVLAGLHGRVQGAQPIDV